MNKFLFLTIFFLSQYCYGAYVLEVKGYAYYKNPNSDVWTKIENDNKLKLNPGDEIKTERASSVEIYLDDGSRVKVAPFSYFKLETEDPASVKINLLFGKIRNFVKKFSRKYEVHTPTAVCAVRGTDFMVSTDGDMSRVEVYDGSVFTGDNFGRDAILQKGEFVEVNKDGGIGKPKGNLNPPQKMDSSISDRKLMARKEIYQDISKESVIKLAQAEMQMSEYQNRKTAIDAFGNRVRMEEYIVRPSAKEFKYVVLNTRENNFNFGKIRFIFNADLPQDLTLATKNMISYQGSEKPNWYLTELNSVMSNTKDKVTEDASNGNMYPDNSLNPSRWDLVFKNYAFYAAGPNQSSENGGLGRLLWSYEYDGNNYNFTFLGGNSPLIERINPMGDNVFNNIVKNTYSDGTWIQSQDFVIFDDGKIVSNDNLASSLTQNSSKESLIDKLNFERVYKSSLFEGREIDLVFSAKLLKDAGMIRF